jgi:hypothetical protein
MDVFHGQIPFGRDRLCPLLKSGPSRSGRVLGRPSGGRPSCIEARKGMETGRAVLWKERIHWRA